MSATDRYLAKVDRKGPQECWPWMAGHFRDGYGKFWDGAYLSSGNSKQVRAHRFGYELHVGPIPAGMKVCHSCDNPPCQNPAHWFLGTAADNNADMMAKGRARFVGPINPARGDRNGRRLHPERFPIGEAHYKAAVSDREVQEIRTRYAQGGVTQREIAVAFGISRSHVSNLVAGRSRVGRR